MESYSITIEDPALVAGITTAREAYNSNIPSDDNVSSTDTNEAYVQFVMSRAAESYAKQYPQQVP